MDILRGSGPLYSRVRCVHCHLTGRRTLQRALVGQNSGGPLPDLRWYVSEVGASFFSLVVGERFSTGRSPMPDFSSVKHHTCSKDA